MATDFGEPERLPRHRAVLITATHARCCKNVGGSSGTELVWLHRQLFCLCRERGALSDGDGGSFADVSGVGTAQPLQLNGLNLSQHRQVRADVLAWLRDPLSVPELRGPFDLIVLDPPTFWNSKRMHGTFDLKRDHEWLLVSTARFWPRWQLLFSTNWRGFRLKPEEFPTLRIKDISSLTLPRDFHDPLVRVCYLIEPDPSAVQKSRRVRRRQVGSKASAGSDSVKLRAGHQGARPAPNVRPATASDFAARCSASASLRCSLPKSPSSLSDCRSPIPSPAPCSFSPSTAHSVSHSDCKSRARVSSSLGGTSCGGVGSGGKIRSACSGAAAPVCSLPRLRSRRRHL